MGKYQEIILNNTLKVKADKLFYGNDKLKNAKIIIRYYKKSSQLVCINTKLILGDIYKEEFLFETNYEKAYEYYRVASLLGN